MAVDHCTIRNGFISPYAGGMNLATSNDGNPIYADIDNSDIYNFRGFAVGAYNNTHATIRNCNITNSAIGVYAASYGYKDRNPARIGGQVTIEGSYLFRNDVGVEATNWPGLSSQSYIQLRNSYIYFSRYSSWNGAVCDLGGNNFYGNAFHAPLPACP